MSRDIIIYIHCPEIMECPGHTNEVQVIDGLLRDICDILKYSFVIGENRSIIYFGRKIDLDYKLERNTKTNDTILKYTIILKDRILGCECNVSRVLDKLSQERAFIEEYTSLIKGIVKDIGQKSLTYFKSYPVQIKFADLKRHYYK